MGKIFTQLEESFNLKSLLKNRESKIHKPVPMQFRNVAGGIKKRLENNMKKRRSSRQSIFDRIRHLSPSLHDSPAPISEAQRKLDHRKQQLEKWKEEKDKKKQETAKKKKKPFIIGVPHHPLTYKPPPKVIPSHSGRVTRSQSAKTKQNKEMQQELAPKNAGFRPPLIRGLTEFPKLVLPNTKANKKEATLVFNPVIPKANSELKKIQSKTTTKKAVKHVADTKTTTKQNSKVAKPVRRAPPVYVQSSSSSDKEYTSDMSSSDKNFISGMTSLSRDTIRKSNASDYSKSVQSSSNSDSETQKKPYLTRNKSRKSGISANVELITQPATKEPNKQSAKSTARNRKTPRKSLTQTKEKQCTPEKPVPKSESSSEERLRSPKLADELVMTPQNIVDLSKRISPRITLSRGKDNARREMKQKLAEGLLDEDSSDLDIDDFRKQLASEIKQITEKCDIWDAVLKEVTLPDTVQELVLGAVGQARLLMSQKLAQFAALVERCANPQAAGELVTKADLHGFWDMVFLQVENVTIRFKKLEELRARNWIEEKPQVKRKVKPVAKPAKQAGKPKPAAPSRLKEMIAAARVAKQSVTSPSPEEKKTFCGGFFKVSSPVRCTPPSCRTPNTLLKAVLSNEAHRLSASKMNASFAMLRAAAFGKNVEVEGISPLPQTPQQHIPLATPGRSILKQTQNKPTASKKKSMKLVYFDQSDSDIDDTPALIPHMIEPAVSDRVIATDVNIQVRSDNEHDLENENKENSKKRRPRLSRQSALDSDDRINTRSRRSRKTVSPSQEKQGSPVPERKTPMRACRKKALEERKTMN